MSPTASIGFDSSIPYKSHAETQRAQRASRRLSTSRRKEVGTTTPRHDLPNRRGRASQTPEPAYLRGFRRQASTSSSAMRRLKRRLRTALRQSSTMKSRRMLAHFSRMRHLSRLVLTGRAMPTSRASSGLSRQSRLTARKPLRGSPSRNRWNTGTVFTRLRG